MIAGKGGLFSIKYHSKFRDLTHAALDDWLNPKKNEDLLAPGMVLANKKLAARIMEKKNQLNNEAAAAIDPKKKAAAPPPVKKEEPPKAAPGGKGKTGPTVEEEQAE